MQINNLPDTLAGWLPILLVYQKELSTTSTFLQLLQEMQSAGTGALHIQVAFGMYLRPVSPSEIGQPCRPAGHVEPLDPRNDLLDGNVETLACCHQDLPRTSK